MAYTEDRAQIIREYLDSALHAINMAYLNYRAETPVMLSAVEYVHTIDAMLTEFKARVHQDIYQARKVCEDPQTCTDGQLCAQCPNLAPMPDGGIMCEITRRNMAD